MDDERDTLLTPEDQRITELVFAGEACERISLETGRHLKPRWSKHLINKFQRRIQMPDQ